MTDPTPQPFLPAPATSTRFQLNFWVVALGAWMTFGVATVLNGLALQPLNDIFPGYGAVNVPDNMREAIWLVLGMWAGGYLAGFLGGLLQERPGYESSIVWSAVLGYEIGAVLRLILIGYFPDVPHEAFTEALDIFYLNAAPTYPTFLLLVLIFGPLMVGLAAVTGSFTAGGALTKFIPTPKIDATTAVGAVLLPMTLLFLRLAYLNYRDIDLSPGVQAGGGRTAGILYIDTLVNPIFNMLVVAFLGIRFGRAYFKRFQTSVIYGVGAGVMIHLLVLAVVYQVLTMYEPTPGTEHDLHLLLPDIPFFIIFWLGPVAVTMIVAFMFQAILQALFGDEPQIVADSSLA